MAGLVDIVLPTGEQAVVLEQDLEQAVAAGAHRAGGPAAASGGADDGGLLGAAAAAAFGAGSSGTFGLSDAILSEGSYLLGGKDLQREVTGEVRRVKEANPYSTMAGEAAGLLAAPGLSAAGEAVEQQVASRVGEGLLGSMASAGARGAAEGAVFGAQKQITEDALGDHEYNGEAIYASAAKDALFGGAFGAVLGAGSYGLKSVGNILKPSRGPASNAVLDEIAGTPGAGRKLAEDAKRVESVVEDLRKTGTTAEQAATMADDVGRMAKESVDNGPASTLLDDAVDLYASAQAKGNAERASVIKQAYKNSQSKLHDVEGKIDQHALTMAEKGTKVLRNLEDVVNDVQFTQKRSQFTKLVDPSLVSAQRDSVATLLQETDDVLKFWESTAAKGGAEGSIKSLRKSWKDALATMSKADELGGETLSRDLYLKTDQLKRGMDRMLQWGRENRYGLPEAVTHAEMGLEPLANKYRAALEDAAVWGEAGKAQERWNASFSTAKARRDHFMSQLGVSIDQQAGIRIPEVDYAKARSLLGSLKGGETDAALQGVKSTEAAISGFRDRVAAIREFGDLSPMQLKKLEQGMAELDDFERAFGAAREDAGSANRLKEAVLEERNASDVGGLLGLASGIVTKPLTTMQRLAQIRQTVQRTEEAIAGGLRRFFGGDADSAAMRIAEKVSPRPKADVAKEIGDIASLRGNPMAMQERAAQMVGSIKEHAPKVAREVELTAIRALDYLSREAPKPSVPLGLVVFDSQKARYSDQQISEFETKRRAALDPQSVISDMQRGKLNRDAIRTVEFVSPKLFAKMQEMAQEQIAKLAESGKLDKMPYQQRAVIATLLKVPADRTWQPDFIAMMQAAKVTPVAESAPQGPPQPNAGVSKRAVEIDSNMFATEASAIEQGGT